MVLMGNLERQTTSVIGMNRPPPGRSFGFTLIEIIMVLALVAILSTIVAYNVPSILRLQNQPPIKRVLVDAVREARFQAAVSKEVSWLTYDAESGIFHVSLDSKAPTPPIPDNTLGSFGSSVLTAPEEDDETVTPPSAIKSYQVYFPEDGEVPKVEFYAIPPGMGYDGDAEDEPEDIPLTRVPFDPAGFSVPFMVQVTDSNSDIRGAFMVFDPFSNHVLKTEGFEPR